MKSKKCLIVLIALAVIQLAFPVSFFAYEKAVEKAAVEKGESYTLRYMNITHFNRKSISLDTEEIYAVGYETDWDVATEYYENEKYIYRDTLSLYSKVVINKNADGEAVFFDAEAEGAQLTEYNWFRTYDVFHLNPEDYEFIPEGFGIKELYEIGILLSRDETNDLTFEQFMKSEDGYFNGIWHIPLDGKVTLKVYKGIAVISEFYIGEDLVMIHKAAKK